MKAKLSEMENEIVTEKSVDASEPKKKLAKRTMAKKSETVNEIKGLDKDAIKSLNNNGIGIDINSKIIYHGEELYSIYYTKDNKYHSAGSHGGYINPNTVKIDSESHVDADSIVYGDTDISLGTCINDSIINNAHIINSKITDSKICATDVAVSICDCDFWKVNTEAVSVMSILGSIIQNTSIIGRDIEIQCAVADNCNISGDNIKICLTKHNVLRNCKILENSEIHNTIVNASVENAFITTKYNIGSYTSLADGHGYSAYFNRDKELTLTVTGMIGAKSINAYEAYFNGCNNNKKVNSKAIKESNKMLSKVIQNVVRARQESEK